MSFPETKPISYKRSTMNFSAKEIKFLQKTANNLEA